MARVKMILLLAAFVVLLIPIRALANDLPLVLTAAQVTNMRLQVYPSDGVQLWYTGSTCAGGLQPLNLPTTATVTDRNRLIAMVIAAKLSVQGMYFYYDNTSSPGYCLINSFGMGMGP